MGELDGKVAFITGAARSQGRSHAIRLAQAGADIIALDICAPLSTACHPGATPADLDETARLVDSLGRRVITAQVDVRDGDALTAALNKAVAELGRLDIVLANAGIGSYGRTETLTDEVWDEMIDINLTGVFKTIRPSIPHLRAAGGGSIVITSSTAGAVGFRNASHYVAAKHGVIGIMKTLANELGPDMIRVNAVLPGSVDTDMIHNVATYALHRPDMDPAAITREDVKEGFARNTPMPVPWMDSADISNAILWLVSDQARYVSGVQLPIDGGRAARS